MSERYIVKVEYGNGGVKVHLDNGDTLGMLSYVEAVQEVNGYSTVKLESYMVKSDD